MQANFQNKEYISDAFPRVDSIGRYINHSLHPNLQLMKPLNVRGKLRIGFVAKCEIKPGKELFWNYGFNRSNGELPTWYTGKPNPHSQAEPTSSHPPHGSDSTSQQQCPLIASSSSNVSVAPSPSPRSKPYGRREVTCMVPGCGQRVKKIWNHLYQTKQHANLTSECINRVCMLIKGL